MLSLVRSEIASASISRSPAILDRLHHELGDKPRSRGCSRLRLSRGIRYHGAVDASRLNAKPQGLTRDRSSVGIRHSRDERTRLGGDRRVGALRSFWAPESDTPRARDRSLGQATQSRLASTATDRRDEAESTTVDVRPACPARPLVLGAGLDRRGGGRRLGGHSPLDSKQRRAFMTTK